MLSDKIKTIIRQAYKAIGENLPQFTPRQQQTLLIAEIAKTLAGEYNKDRRIITIEAGTGTGKSLAYCLGVIPLALAQKRKVCLSTATVALQEQLVDKDLPFLQKYSGLSFDFQLVKGRQRYVCRQKLVNLVEALNDDNPQTNFTFAEKPQQQDITLLKTLNQQLQQGQWSGDIDQWSDPIPHPIWQQIQSDKHSCLRHLSEHQHCPFHQAREKIDQADVLVINHSLLLADLALGGGKILPEPSECFYVIDEAHHLPSITRDHASATIHVKGAIDWIEKLSEVGNKTAKLIKTQRAIAPSLSLADDSTDLFTTMKQVLSFLQSNQPHYFANNPKQEPNCFRFEHGKIPDSLLLLAQDAAELSKKILASLNKLYNFLLEALKDNAVKVAQAEPLLAELGFFIQRAENLAQLWHLYAQVDAEKATPLARWINLLEGKRVDFALSASPIDVGFMLEDKLWSQCAGAVLCSATLRAVNSFDHFRRQAGLQQHDGSQYLNVLSPFDYQQRAKLIVPQMQYEPTAEQFTDEIIEKIPTFWGEHKACLVLFSSYWQMRQVASALLKKNPKLPLLMQGEFSRQHIIATHKKRIDNDEKSIIFGTQSFSEGLDLPGKYLTHLTITKLPFSVPTSPVEQAQTEHISAKGGNPFMSLTIPEASKKLIQACGRLLRNEQDFGEVVLLDRRVVSKRYGQQLLDSLPPFYRIIE